MDRKTSRCTFGMYGQPIVVTSISSTMKTLWMLLLCLAMTASGQTLIGSYDLAGNANNSVSGYPNGTWMGTLTTDRWGNQRATHLTGSDSIYFDGYLNYTYAAQAWSIWFKADSQGGVLVSNGLINIFETRASTSQISFLYRPLSGSLQVTTVSYTPDACGWNLLYVQDSMAHFTTVYVNGSKTALSGDILISPARIGKGFVGSVDDFMLWSHFLEKKSIDSLWANRPIVSIRPHEVPQTPPEPCMRPYFKGRFSINGRVAQPGRYIQILNGRLEQSR